MDLRQLEIIRAIAETGSFTGAGEKLHVSQSAVSRQVLLLEEELGEAVFLRVGRRVRITPAGESLLQLSHRIFQDLHDTVAGITDARTTLTGTLHLVGGMTVSLYVFPELLAAFHTTHPGVEVRLTAGSDETCTALIRKGTADLGLLTLPIDDVAFVSQPAFDEELLLVTATSHPLARRKRVVARDLKHETFIVYDPASHVRRIIDELFVREHIEPRLAMETDNAEIIKALVRTGLGIAFLPYQVVASEAKDGQLFCARVHGESLVRQAAWVYPKASRVPRAVRALMDVFEEMKPRLRFAPTR